MYETMYPIYVDQQLYIYIYVCVCVCYSQAISAS